MPVIGLTGNIGSGKSTVAGLLAELGARVIDADLVAREVVRPGSPGLEEITRVFGRKVINEKGELDRKIMADIVFRDQQARTRLNEITHPRIKEAILEEINKTRSVDNPVKGEVLVIDAPLLIETGLHYFVDETWVVKVDEKTQIERLARRDGLSPEETHSRIAAQMPQSDKLKYARRVIDNSGEPAWTREQVYLNWAGFLGEQFHGTGE